MSGKAPPPARRATPGRSKYGVDTSRQGKADRTVNGMLFASKREAARYTELVWMERQGLISELRCQVRYPLAVNGVKITTYVSDFVYTQDGRGVIEDAKGVKTPAYRIKALLMLAVHGVRIKET